MTPTRTLIAATDFSAPARHALERAAQIAQSHRDARLLLAHVVSATALDALRRLLPGEAGAVEDQLLAQAKRTLDELVAGLATRYDSRIDTELLQGSALAALPELVRSQPDGMLVMGARGAHFVREMLLGSTTERVLRKTCAPVLAVKHRPQTPYRRILAAVDFSTHCAAAVNAAHAWFPDADIVLLHAFEVELESTFRLAGMDDARIHGYRLQAREAAVADMDAFVASLKVPAQRLTREFVHGPATLRIVEHEQTMDADLVVMGKRGQSVMEDLLLGSVTKHALAYCSSDVLVVGQPKAAEP